MQPREPPRFDESRTDRTVVDERVVVAHAVPERHSHSRCPHRHDEEGHADCDMYRPAVAFRRGKARRSCHRGKPRSVARERGQQARDEEGSSPEEADGSQRLAQDH